MRSKCAITKISTHFAHYRNGLQHQHRADIRSYVKVGLMALPSTCPEICVASLITGVRIYREYSRFALMNESAAFFGNYPLLKCGVFTKIRNHVDKYVITKHYYQLLLFGDFQLFNSGFRELKATWLSYALGYASGKILKISNFLKYSPRLYPQAMPQGK
ncbi:hypothetical protein Tsp_13141 [Trichinella spiralis]|uniref:hypothetical protein n=1 Tax=Trichinella spiralis TaxID=6334 RepID=UPI0001EFE064|nr:hypothetical protein Tsp_13141 [Trichinella spiralis]